MEDNFTIWFSYQQTGNYIEDEREKANERELEINYIGFKRICNSIKSNLNLLDIYRMDIFDTFEKIVTTPIYVPYPERTNDPFRVGKIEWNWRYREDVEPPSVLIKNKFNDRLLRLKNIAGAIQSNPKEEIKLIQEINLCINDLEQIIIKGKFELEEYRPLPPQLKGKSLLSKKIDSIFIRPKIEKEFNEVFTKPDRIEKVHELLIKNKIITLVINKDLSTQYKYNFGNDVDPIIAMCRILEEKAIIDKRKNKKTRNVKLFLDYYNFPEKNLPSDRKLRFEKSDRKQITTWANIFIGSL